MRSRIACHRIAGSEFRSHFITCIDEPFARIRRLTDAPGLQTTDAGSTNTTPIERPKPGLRDRPARLSERLFLAALEALGTTLAAWPLFVTGFTGVVALVLAHSRSERTIDLRNAAIGVSIVTVLAASFVLGATHPTYCGMF